MIDPDRQNHVKIHHHFRDDTVVLLPWVTFQYGGTAFGSGAILPRTDAASIGDAIISMLDHCAAADTSPLAERRATAMERLRSGFDLSFDEQCPSFDTADNWGRIYERYPALLLNPWTSSRYFAPAMISDSDDTRLLALDYLQLLRKDKGIYTTAHSEVVDREAGPASVGKIVSDRLHSWRPKLGFFSRLTG